MYDFELEKLVDAVDRYAAARHKHDEAYREYDGYSWDLAGDDYICELNSAKEEFRNVLDEYIGKKVEEKLKERDDKSVELEPSQVKILEKKGNRKNGKK